MKFFLIILLFLGIFFFVYTDAEEPPLKNTPGASNSALRGGESDLEVTEITPEHRAAVEKGLKYLARRQSKLGSWGEHYQVAVTSLAGLAFLAGGHLPGEGKYGNNVKSALRFILKCASKQGYIAEPGGMASRMHGHGFATWFLAEIYGMTHNPAVVNHEELKTVLSKAIKVIENAQSKEGGWYYEPVRGGDEGSVTVCIVQALKAARNVGIEIKKEVIDQGINYLIRSANPDGSFKYSVRSGTGSGSFALAAGGVSSLCLYGMFDLPETKRGFDYLMRFKPGTNPNWQQGYPYYSNFYAALAMYLARAKYWNEWFPALKAHLLKIQHKDGNWSGEVDNDYATAFACLMLQIPYQYLPLFQR